MSADPLPGSANVGADLRRLKDESNRIIDAALGALAALNQDLQQLRQASSNALQTGLNLPSVRDALVGSVMAPDANWKPVMLATHGSGPWETEEFDSFLFDRDFELWEMPDPEVDGLIVGRSDWRPEALAEQAFGRNSAPLRVYPQELFVLGMVLGVDPLDALPIETLEEIGRDHPAIRYLLDQRFPWPNLTRSPSGDDTQAWDDADRIFQDNTPLSLLGYSVAEGRLTPSQRRRLLRQAFEAADLPGVETEQDQARWGVAQSGQRLYAISAHLSWLSRFSGAVKPAARQKWHEDLEWLRKTFYGRVQGFAWPAASLDSPPRPHGSPLKRKPNQAFMRPMKPSPPLAAIIGFNPVPRTEVTKRVWDYIKAHRLQDPSNGRMILADSKLAAVLGRSSVSMFEIPKLINEHLT